jgi:hypothetical protein
VEAEAVAAATTVASVAKKDKEVTAVMRTVAKAVNAAMREADMTEKNVDTKEQEEATVEKRDAMRAVAAADIVEMTEETTIVLAADTVEAVEGMTTIVPAVDTLEVVVDMEAEMTGVRSLLATAADKVDLRDTAAEIQTKSRDVPKPNATTMDLAAAADRTVDPAEETTRTTTALRAAQVATEVTLAATEATQAPTEASSPLAHPTAAAMVVIPVVPMSSPALHSTLSPVAATQVTLDCSVWLSVF